MKKYLIPNRADIDLRSQEAGNRLEFEHFEVDAIVSSKDSISFIDFCSSRQPVHNNPKALFDFENPDISKEDYANEIVKRLENNPALLKTIYKIIMALDY